MYRTDSSVFRLCMLIFGRVVCLGPFYVSRDAFWTIIAMARSSIRLSTLEAYYRGHYLYMVSSYCAEVPSALSQFLNLKNHPLTDSAAPSVKVSADGEAWAESRDGTEFVAIFPSARDNCQKNVSHPSSIHSQCRRSVSSPLRVTEFVDLAKWHSSVARVKLSTFLPFCFFRALVAGESIYPAASPA